MSGSDPLVVEDWSAYEKSMLDVLREERRTRPKLAPVERPMSPDELRQFVQGRMGEAESVESSVGDAAPQPVALQFPREQGGQVSLSMALEKEVPRAGTVPQPAVLSVLREQTGHVPLSAVLPDEQPGHEDEPPPKPAEVEGAHERSPPAAAPIAPGRSVDHPASWWRIPVILSSLAVAVAGTAVAVLKPVRDVSRAPAVAISQAQPAEKDTSAVVSTKNAGAAVSIIPAPASEPGTSEYQVSGDRVRLRGAPGVYAPVLRTLQQGTAVAMKERSPENEWCRVEAAGGLAGWMMCDFLKPVAVQRD